MFVSPSNFDSYTFYGLFNLEYIFDLTPYQSVSPLLVIKNCQFNDFIISRTTNGWSNLFSLAPYSGILSIQNTSFKRCFFPNGLIYYSKTLYDELFSIVINNNYIVTIQQQLIVNYSYIENYGDSSILLISKLMNFYCYTGNITIINSNLVNIFNSSYVLYVENLDFTSRVNVFNISLANLSQVGLFQIIYAISLNITDTVIWNCSNIQSNMFYLENILINSFTNLIFKSIILISKSNNMFHLKNSETILQNCLFHNISSQNDIFYFFSKNILIYNCIFQTISSQINLFSFFQSNNTNISCSYFLNISVLQSIILVSTANSLIFDRILIKLTNFSTVFFLVNVLLNYNKELNIFSCNLIRIWSIDHSCLITKWENSLFQGNIINTKIFSISSLPNSYLIFSNVYFFNNNVTTNTLISMYIGIGNFSSFIAINNYFINADKYTNAFDFESKSQVYMDSCIFIDNGAIARKNVYLSKDQNAMICLWTLKYSHFSNSYFIASSLIDFVTGFINAEPHSGLFESYNNSFIIMAKDYTQFRYKGMILDSFIKVLFVNNIFLNLGCNYQTTYHTFGGVTLGGAASLSYRKNNRIVYLENNTFNNCQCIYGGGLAILSICNVTLKNNKFINSTSTLSGGHLLIAGGENLIIDEIFLNNSSCDEGSGIYLKNFININIKNLILSNAYSRKNGVIYVKNVISLQIIDSYANNLTTQMNGGFICLLQTTAFLKNITITSVSAFLDGGIIYIHLGSNLTMFDCVSYSTHAIKGGSFSIENAYTISIINCIFINSMSYGQASVMFIDLIDSFMLSNVSFTACKTLSTGTIFIKTEDESSQFDLYNVTCRNTESKIGSCLYFLSASKLNIILLNIFENGVTPVFILWSFPISINISNLLIKDTYIESNLIYVEGVIIEFNSIILSNNTGSILLLFQYMSGMFNNCSFENNQGNFLVSLDYCSINFNVITFRNNISFFSATNSFTNLTTVQALFSNTSKVSEYVLIVQSNGYLSVENSIFSYNIGLLFKLINMNFMVIDSFFYNNNNYDQKDISPNEIDFENVENSHYFIYFFRNYFFINQGFSMRSSGHSDVSIIDTSYVSFGLGQSSSIIINEASHILIENSRFDNFTNGNLLIYNNAIVETSYILIFLTSFRNNSGLLGGAIYIEGNFQTNISNSLFDNNKAFTNKNNDNSLQGISPCIFNKDLALTNSSFSLSSCQFINNSAKFIASTVFSQVSIENLNNSFMDNFDSLNFTCELFSFPLSLYIPDNKSLNITSGKAFDLKVDIFDAFGQKLIFDNKTILTIKKNSTQSSVSIENGLAIAKQGSLIFIKLLIKAKPNSTLTLSFSGKFLGLLNNINNQLNPMQIEQNFDFYVRECLIGEILTVDGSCYFCPKDTYSLIDPMEIEQKYQKCNPCPENSICYGGKYIVPQYGYYRKSNTSINSVSCITQDACLGSPPLELIDNYIADFNISLINGICTDGNIDTLCFYCDFNYGRYEKTQHCKKCATLSDLIYFRLCFYFIGIIGYIILNIIYSIEYKTNESDNSINGTLIKLLINHNQYIMLILISIPTIDFPAFQSILNSSDYLSFANDDVLSNDCLIQKIYYDKETNTIYKDLINNFLPIIFSLLSFVIWIAMNLFLSIFKKYKHFYRKIPNTIKRALSKLLLFVFISIFIFYPLVLKSCFDLFKCIIIDEFDSYSYLRSSPNMKCWIKPHLFYILCLGLPGLIVWGVCFPLILFVTLRKNVNFINKTSTEMSLMTTHPIDFEINKKKKRSLKNIEDIEKELESSNNSKFYYCECLIFLSKFLLTFLSSLIETISDEIIVFLMIILIIFSLQFTLKAFPYKKKLANQLEIFSLIICLITVFSSMVFRSNLSNNFINFFAIICLIFNLLLYCFVVTSIIRNLIKNNFNKSKSQKIRSYTQKLKIDNIYSTERSINNNKSLLKLTIQNSNK